MEQETQKTSNVPVKMRKCLWRPFWNHDGLQLGPKLLPNGSKLGPKMAPQLKLLIPFRICPFFFIRSRWCLEPTPKGVKVKHPHRQSPSSLMIQVCPLVVTNITMENCHLKWVFPLKMVIFHSYVKLPEGNMYIVISMFRCSDYSNYFALYLNTFWHLRCGRILFGERIPIYSSIPCPISEPIFAKLGL